jgi:hypothetical protein
MLSACSDFVFEIEVLTIEDDVQISIDGEVKAQTVVDGYRMVVVTQVFSDYVEGAQWRGFEVEIGKAGQQIYSQLFRPGYCAQRTNDFDWHEESLRVATSPQPGLSRYTCDGPSGSVKVIVD